MPLPVALYIPNILCYLRIVLAYAGCYYSTTDPLSSVWMWIIAAALDMFDGMLARRLNQCSSLGVLLDIFADNILRTSIWIAAAIQDDRYRILAAFFVSIEWTTMICTQLHSYQSGKHWKQCREDDPKLLQCIFANNFKTPIGGLCVYGLFTAGMFLYCKDHQTFPTAIPFFSFFMYAAFLGRGLSVFAETWLCKEYISLVIEKDEKGRNAKSEKEK